jgi:hypothetical protein
MTRVTWDNAGQRFYEAGVDRGMLYIGTADGIPWNGLISVAENPSGGATTGYYTDGVRYITDSEREEFGATISAYTYPDEFGECDGSAEVNTGLFVLHQKRKPFSLSYRTKVGNDLQGLDFAYKIHLVYNALAAPSKKTFASLTDNGTPADFSWDISVTPPTIAAEVYSSGHVVIDSKSISPEVLATVEGMLYGTDSTGPRMPSLDELNGVMGGFEGLTITDNGDGTFTADGPDGIVTSLGFGVYQISSSGATDNGDGTFTVTST